MPAVDPPDQAAARFADAASDLLTRPG